MRYGLRFGLLGPPVLYDADGEVRPIGSGKMRALLVALLLEPGRVVSVDALKDALWGGTPPASAQASLQNHVTRLRRLLDDPERLRAVPPGYVLRVGEGESDVRVFESHVTAARAAHAGRDGEGALREALEGLALWRGTPLGGVRSELGGHALVQRLEEARLLLLEWRYEAELWLAGTAAARAGSEAGAGSAGSGTTGDDGGGPGSSARPGGTPGGAEGAEGAAGVAGMRGSGTRKGLAKADGSGGSTGFAGADGSGGLLGTTGGIGPGCARLAALAPELAALVAEHPLREAFHRLLMLVLHRTGRQAEALAVHRDLRARLVEELGVEPGPAVREAHLEILRERDPGGFAGSPGARGSTRTGRADAADGSGRPGGPRGAGGRPAGRPGGGVGPAGSDGNQGNHGNHGRDGSRGNDGNDAPGGTDGPYGAGAVEQDGRTETDAAAGPTRTPSPRPAQPGPAWSGATRPRRRGVRERDAARPRGRAAAPRAAPARSGRGRHQRYGRGRQERAGPARGPWAAGTFP
ncbi:AfsR/SARP family transcriptional regulator [Streptomyces sp. ME109]|uniref:AfsR/SARP family transcriptional regulator n=1 Tax=Streptomyces sp. me109 TaxID=1827853 RepID=UPI0021C6D44C|nr:BTAD domain-containing putative transcriptional regulator [Streptomyces sp. me109]